MVAINNKIVGALVTFHGFDGKDYPALVSRVSRKVATVQYRVYVGGLNRRNVTAYVSDPARLTVGHPDHPIELTQF